MTVIVFVCLVSTDWIVLHFSFWNALYSFSSNGNNIPKIPIIRQWLYSDHFLKQLWNSYAETIFCCCWSACECQHSENPPRPMCDHVFPPRQHTAMMSNTKSYVCPVCGRVLSSPGSLGRHLLIHSEDRLSNCAVCGTRFTDMDNLNRSAPDLWTASPP